MKPDIKQRLDSLDIDDIVWYAYIFIAVAALYSNKIEKDFVVTNSRTKEKEFHAINLIVLTIAFLIYIFFVLRNFKTYQNNKNSKSLINLIASILFLVAGGILLWLEAISTEDENNELGI